MPVNLFGDPQPHDRIPRDFTEPQEEAVFLAQVKLCDLESHLYDLEDELIACEEDWVIEQEIDDTRTEIDRAEDLLKAERLKLAKLYERWNPPLEQRRFTDAELAG